MTGDVCTVMVVCDFIAQGLRSYEASFWAILVWGSGCVMTGVVFERLRLLVTLSRRGCARTGLALLFICGRELARDKLKVDIK